MFFLEFFLFKKSLSSPWWTTRNSQAFQRRGKSVYEQFGWCITMWLALLFKGGGVLRLIFLTTIWGTAPRNMFSHSSSCYLEIDRSTCGHVYSTSWKPRFDEVLFNMEVFENFYFYNSNVLYSRENNWTFNILLSKASHDGYRWKDLGVYDYINLWQMCCYVSGFNLIHGLLLEKNRIFLHFLEIN